MTTTAISDAAEAQFAHYLAARGYTFTTEPDVGIRTRPDFLITDGDHTVVAEVKALTTRGPFTGPGTGAPVSRPIAQALKPVRNQIASAARQLKPLRDRGWPLVIILANPAQRPVPLSPLMVASAMYGDLRLEARRPTEDAPFEEGWAAGRNGKLTVDHPYVSAVAVVRTHSAARAWAEEWFVAHREEFGDDSKAMAEAFRSASEDVLRDDEAVVDVIETLSPSAVPLPGSIFNGPHDQRWTPVPDTTSLAPRVH